MNNLDGFYTVEQVLSCLKNYYAIAEKRFYIASEVARDIKLDIDFIVSKLQLTERQDKVLDLHYKQGYNQGEIAEKLGTSQVNIYYHIKAIKKKIEKYVRESAPNE